jgi:hypothetical protein
VLLDPDDLELNPVPTVSHISSHSPVRTAGMKRPSCLFTKVIEATIRRTFPVASQSCACVTFQDRGMNFAVLQFRR